MSIFKTLFSFSLIMIGVVLLSCSDSGSTNPINNPTTSFTCTLNGGGYNNKVISYTTAGGAVYSPVENYTGITFGSTTSDAAVIVFKGKSTGNFIIEENEDKYQNGVVLNFAGNNGLAITSGKITVSAFGNVGGNVSGTFSGTAPSTVPGQTVQITNGSFSATRVF